MSRLLALTGRQAGQAAHPGRGWEGGRGGEAARAEPDLDSAVQAGSSPALREPPWVRGLGHRAGSGVSGLSFLNLGGG